MSQQYKWKAILCLSLAPCLLKSNYRAELLTLYFIALIYICSFIILSAKSVTWNTFTSYRKHVPIFLPLYPIMQTNLMPFSLSISSAARGSNSFKCKCFPVSPPWLVILYSY
jgi:hypothetical protein